MSATVTVQKLAGPTVTIQPGPEPTVAISVPGMQGAQGPQGPQGAAGSPGVTEYPAGQALSALRVIRVSGAGQAFYADNRNLDDRGSIAGISSTSGGIGAMVSVIDGKTLTDTSWAFTPGSPLFLGQDGNIVSTPPSSPGAAFSMQVGQALSATTIMVRLRRPIIL